MKKIEKSITAALFLSGCLLSGSLLAASGPEQRLIIKYKNSVQDSVQSHLPDAVLNRYAVKMTHLRKMAIQKQHVFKLDKRLNESDFANLIRDLSENDQIDLVEEDRIMKPNFTPNDSRYNEQWHYFESTGGINLPAAWDKSTGLGVVVAVLDTGYTDHSDLNANLIQGYDFISDTFVSVDGDGRDNDASDPGDAYSFGECGPGIPGSSSSWHGTHVAGTVAAVTDNSQGVAGIAYNAAIMPVRVLGKCGGYTSDIADGIIWASGGTVSGVPDTTTPAQVVNMSLGGSGSCSSTMQNAIDTAISNGTTVVVSAGNSDANAANFSPASCNGVITVAANDRNGDKAWYSNFGNSVEISAPGGDTSISSNGVLSTLNSGSQGPVNESYEFYQGTSMSAPHITGVAALLYSVKPDATPQQVADAMTSTARSFPGNCAGGCGAGIVDASAAIDAIDNSTPVMPSRLIRLDLSGTRLSWSLERFQVPENSSRLLVRTFAGTGDVDLYVRFGARPTPANYDCRPNLFGNDEVCVIDNPQAGEWFIGLRGRRDYSGVNLIGIAE